MNGVEGGIFRGADKLEFNVPFYPLIYHPHNQRLTLTPKRRLSLFLTVTPKPSTKVSPRFRMYFPVICVS